MKQLYRVPFDCNSDRVKEQRFQGFFNWMQWKDPMNTSTWIKLGLISPKGGGRGRNVIGHRTIVGVPGQRGGNVTLCAAISNHGVVHHHANLGPYNTHQLLIFLNHMLDALLGQQDEHPIYVVVWDNVSFHRALQFRVLSIFAFHLNPIEEFFSSWRWKVYGRQPYTRVNLLQAMGLACGDIGVEACQARIRHARVFFPRCLARQNVACDVDEVLWPDPVRRHDAVAE